MAARIIGKAGNPYRGNVVSPPGNDHLYFYIRQEDGKNDRGIMVFYIDDDMQSKYKCGSGILLSTDRNSRKTRLQWTVIIRIGESEPPFSKDTMTNLRYIQENEIKFNDEDLEFEKTLREIDEIVVPILKEDIPKPEKYYIQFDCLHDRQSYLYKEYKKRYGEKETGLVEKQVEITKELYEKALAELERVEKDLKDRKRSSDEE